MSSVFINCGYHQVWDNPQSWDDSQSWDNMEYSSVLVSATGY